MTTGTKSVLFGAHAFWLHFIFVAAAWTKLYGFPWDLRLWFAFLLHDVGYVGLIKMDDEKGEEHPVLGAKIMGWLFDWGTEEVWEGYWFDGHYYTYIAETRKSKKWYYFTLLHSRHYAKKYNMQPSRLCVADKLVPCLMPAWLYLSMTTATGEIEEYLENGAKAARDPKTPFNDFERTAFGTGEHYSWFLGLQSYMRRWVYAHKDGQVDGWTKGSQAT